ncbi:jg7303 [Pararge aegeria aegeria]|uniref:Jg7303 protein n=1 Tax=Pararge aegeria aegeria TaxID=348720 RepID=A0A8S4RGW3_9NEOP|nr:jg7303 [Pararge aegeria aegeria]
MVKNALKSIAWNRRSIVFVFPHSLYPFVLILCSSSWSLTKGLIFLCSESLSGRESYKFGLSLRDQIRNEENKSYRSSTTSCEAEVAMVGAYSSQNGWSLGSQGAGMAAPPRTAKRSVVRPLDSGQKTLSAPQEASGRMRI